MADATEHPEQSLDGNVQVIDRPDGEAQKQDHRDKLDKLADLQGVEVILTHGIEVTGHVHSAPSRSLPAPRIRARADTIRDELADDHHQRDAEHDRAGVVPFVCLHLLGEHVADTARADHAQDRCAPQVDVELEDHVSDDHRIDLRNVPEQEHDERIGTGPLHGLDGPTVDILDGLGGGLGNETDGANAQGDNAR